MGNQNAVDDRQFRRLVTVEDELARDGSTHLRGYPLRPRDRNSSMTLASYSKMSLTVRDTLQLLQGLRTGLAYRRGTGTLVRAAPMAHNPNPGTTASRPDTGRNPPG